MGWNSRPCLDLTSVRIFPLIFHSLLEYFSSLNSIKSLFIFNRILSLRSLSRLSVCLLNFVDPRRPASLQLFLKEIIALSLDLINCLIWINNFLDSVMEAPSDSYYLGERRSYYLPWEGGLRRFDFPLVLVKSFKSKLSTENAQQGSFSNSIGSPINDSLNVSNPSGRSAQLYDPDISLSSLHNSMDIDDHLGFFVPGIDPSSFYRDQEDGSEPPFKRRRISPEINSGNLSTSSSKGSLPTKIEPEIEKKIVELENRGSNQGPEIPRVRGYLKQSDSWKGLRILVVRSRSGLIMRCRRHSRISQRCVH